MVSTGSLLFQFMSIVHAADSEEALTKFKIDNLDVAKKEEDPLPFVLA